MPLNDSTFKNDLKTAFEEEEWDSSADKVATAIDDYIKSGTVMTIVTGGIITLSYPPWTSVYTGSGTGNIDDTQLSALKPLIKAAFQQEEWDGCAQMFADAIDSHMQSAKATITDLPPEAGNDTTTIITAAGAASLGPDIKDAFNNGDTWDIFGELFCTALKKFIQACIVNTTDSGISVAPPGPMNGATGIGSIM
jgi:hypothetical protein